MPGAGSFLPCGGASPGAMFVRQDVDDLLDELHGRHMVAVLGCPDQVVAHSLLVPFVRRILRTGRLAWKKEPKHEASGPRKCTFRYKPRKCAMFSYMETLL